MNSGAKPTILAHLGVVDSDRQRCGFLLKMPIRSRLGVKIRGWRPPQTQISVSRMLGNTVCLVLFGWGLQFSSHCQISTDAEAWHSLTSLPVRWSWWEATTTRTEAGIATWDSKIPKVMISTWDDFWIRQFDFLKQAIRIFGTCPLYSFIIKDDCLKHLGATQVMFGDGYGILPQSSCWEPSSTNSAGRWVIFPEKTLTWNWDI